MPPIAAMAGSAAKDPHNRKTDPGLLCTAPAGRRGSLCQRDGHAEPRVCSIPGRRFCLEQRWRRPAPPRDKYSAGGGVSARELRAVGGGAGPGNISGPALHIRDRDGLAHAFSVEPGLGSSSDPAPGPVGGGAAKSYALMASQFAADDDPVPVPYPQRRGARPPPAALLTFSARTAPLI